MDTQIHGRRIMIKRVMYLPGINDNSLFLRDLISYAVYKDAGFPVQII